MTQIAQMHIHAAWEGHTRGQSSSMPVWTQLFWSATDRGFLLWSREHHIIFLHYNLCCSWQILLSRSRDRCFFVFPLSSNDEKTEFFRQTLSFDFFSPRLSFVPSQTRHPSCLLPWSLVSFSRALISPECVWDSAFDAEQCETFLSVKLMPLCSPEQSVSVSLLLQQWDIWIVKSVLVANKPFNGWHVPAELPESSADSEHKADHRSVLLFITYLGYLYSIVWY